MGWVKMKTCNRLFLSLVTIPYFIWWILYLVVIFQLRHFFSTLKTGNPFIKKNAYRIRKIGWSIICAEILRILTVFLTPFTLAKQLLNIGYRRSLMVMRKLLRITKNLLKNLRVESMRRRLKKNWKMHWQKCRTSEKNILTKHLVL